MTEKELLEKIEKFPLCISIPCKENPSGFYGAELYYKRLDKIGVDNYCLHYDCAKGCDSVEWRGRLVEVYHDAWEFLYHNCFIDE